MPRNLFKRIETCFPLTDPEIIDHVEEILTWFWKDNVKAKRMDQDGNYHSLPVTEESFDVQQAFVNEAQARKRRG
jgi:polyphosphate kinase